MKVLLTAATDKELHPLYKGNNSNVFPNLQLQFSITGVGLLASTFSLTKLLSNNRPDLILQIGIAGSFDSTCELGKVFVIANDVVADQGVMENKTWKSVFDLGLVDANEFPYIHKQLPNPGLDKYNILQLPLANAITVNSITSLDIFKEQYLRQYHPLLESMEGAALHYVASMLTIPFLQIRSVSNYIGERDKSKWKFSTAIEKLTDTTIAYLQKLNAQS